MCIFMRGFVDLLLVKELAGMEIKQPPFHLRFFSVDTLAISSTR